MKVSANDLKKTGPDFAAELLDLLKKYNLHDGKSKLTIGSRGFSVALEAMRDDCPEACRVCEMVTPTGGGRPRLVCRCTC